MTFELKQIQSLLKAGKRAEARALLDAQLKKAEFAPTEIIQETGNIIFKSRGREVVLGEDGSWRPKG